MAPPTPEDRRRLKAEYGDLLHAVSDILRRYDPVGLIRMGAPLDEYEPEAGTIVARLDEVVCEKDARRIVTEEFVAWFSEDTPLDAEALQRCGSDVWRLALQSRNLVFSQP